MQTCIIIFLDVDVDGEMSIDVTHFVFVALGHADDEVVDKRLDCS